MSRSLPLEEIESLCQKWRIRELSLFGSVLRDDFHPGSDVDVLVEFEPEARWSLFDFVDLQDELEGLLQRSSVRSGARRESWPDSGPGS